MSAGSLKKKKEETKSSHPPRPEYSNPQIREKSASQTRQRILDNLNRAKVKKEWGSPAKSHGNELDMELTDESPYKKVVGGPEAESKVEALETKQI